MAEAVRVQTETLLDLRLGSGGFESSFNAVAWSPDGSRLAVGGDDGTARVLSRGGEQLWRGAGHASRVWSVAWSPDARWLASASEDNTLLVWDAATGAVVRRCEGHTDHVRSVAWSPDGRWLASASRDRTLRVWDASTGEVVRRCEGHTNHVRSVAWSPDGRWLASGAYDDTARVWDVATGLEVRRDEGHGDGVMSVAWSPDGRWFASGWADGTVRVGEADTGAEVRRWVGHAHSVRHISWSPDGHRLASASEDRTLRVWDVPTGVEVLRCEGHTDQIWSVAWSSEGGCLASVADDGRLLLWATPASVAPAAPSGWAARQAASVGRRPPPAGELWMPSLPGGDGVGWGRLGAGGAVGDAPAVAVSPGGRRVAWGWARGVVHISDLATGAELGRCEGHTGAVRSVAWSPDGRRLASGSNDHTVRIWDAAGVQYGNCAGPSIVGSVGWSPDGRHLASGSSDGIVRVWDAATGVESRCATGHSRLVWCVAWSPDGHRLATGSADGTVRVWDAATGVEVFRGAGDSAEVNSVTWSPDGLQLASGSDDGKVRVWDIGTGVEVRRSEGHSGWVRSVAWSPDGRHVASGSADHTVRVWDAATGVERLRFNAPEFAFCVAWAPHGGFLVSGHGGHVVRIWDTRALVDTTPPGPVHAALQALPRAATIGHSLGLSPPLSLLHDIQALTGGAPPTFHPDLAVLRPALRPLIDLRWPPPSRLALLPLLLDDLDLPFDPPPTDISPADLRRQLTHALAGPACPPTPPQVPVAPLLDRATRRLTGEDGDRLLTLLNAVDPLTLSLDPSLLRRLLADLPHVPALAAHQRAQLRARIEPRAEDGPMHGPGSGCTRTGLARRGPPHALLPSQLALPPDLLAWQHQHGGLLYRTRASAAPPRHRPLVLALDVSPPTWGPIEQVTRVAALAVARSLMEARVPLRVLLLGGRPRLLAPSQPKDLLVLLTDRTHGLNDPPGDLATAAAALAQLEGEDLPAVLLLSHAWYGANDLLPVVQDLRALLVQYPGQGVAPPLARHCARWASVAHDAGVEVERALCRLVG